MKRRSACSRAAMLLATATLTSGCGVTTVAGTDVGCDSYGEARRDMPDVRLPPGPRWLGLRIVAEAANGPVTSDASEILAKRGVMVIPDNYLNAGGVIVSYFEWTKNLSHMRFGRMAKRFESQAYRRILGAVEQATGHHFTEDDYERLARGADELDLVRSGLEDTMVTAYRDIREIHLRHRDKADLRTAAFINAIDKVALCYQELGIFP